MPSQTSLPPGRTLDVTAIFGGIGGLELGLHQSGHTTSLFCENNADAVSILRRRFPDVNIASDVRKTDEILGMLAKHSQLLTAGFPCTDLSQAGLTMGFSGGRSSLIRETIDLLRRRPFPHVLIENVPNWRHLHHGLYLSEVVTALESLEYRWAYRTIDALAFGLPQRRKRIFLYATLEGDPRDVLFHGRVTPVDVRFPLNEAAHGFYWTEGNRGLGWGEDCIPTLKGGSSMNIPSPPAVLLPDRAVVTPDVRDAERLQGLPVGWTDINGATVDGRRFNQRSRWMLIGNAVNVKVSKWIGKQLRNPRPFNGSAGIPLAVGAPWPMAAWSDGKHRYATDVSSWPVDRRRTPLAAFLRHPGSPLSLRATAGFYSRMSASSLRFKTGFKEAIAEHLKRMERLVGKASSRTVRAAATGNAT